MNFQSIYILRLDDACPTMKWNIWLELEKILDRYDIKPIIGVIPDCKDPKLQFQKPRKGFWEWVVNLKTKGWHIAMHGY